LYLYVKIKKRILKQGNLTLGEQLKNFKKEWCLLDNIKDKFKTIFKFVGNNIKPTLTLSAGPFALKIENCSALVFFS